MRANSWKVLAALALLVAGCSAASGGAAAESRQAAGQEPTAAGAAEEKRVVIDHKLQSLEGEPVDLASFRGKALLIVNVASECGYTPQYAELEQLYQRYKDRGLVVLGIPSNDFGGQEPGTAEEIRKFCDLRYKVTFPMMAKVHAKGPEIAPLYDTLTTATSPELRGEIEWNFTKFVVDADGVPTARFASKVKPLSQELVAAVEAALPKS